MNHVVFLNRMTADRIITIYSKVNYEWQRNKTCDDNESTRTEKLRGRGGSTVQRADEKCFPLVFITCASHTARGTAQRSLRNLQPVCLPSGPNESSAPLFHAWSPPNPWNYDDDGCILITSRLSDSFGMLHAITTPPPPVFFPPPSYLHTFKVLDILKVTWAKCTRHLAPRSRPLTHCPPFVCSRSVWKSAEFK